jgi:hypothetical protein
MVKVITETVAFLESVVRVFVAPLTFVLGVKRRVLGVMFSVNAERVDRTIRGRKQRVTEAVDE